MRQQHKEMKRLLALSDHIRNQLRPFKPVEQQQKEIEETNDRARRDRLIAKLQEAKKMVRGEL